MQDNFEVKLQLILKKMEDERHNLHHPFVGTEHLVLSLLKNDDEIKEIFLKYNITYDSFKTKLISLVGPVSKNVEYNLYTPLLKRVINNALLEVNDAKLVNSKMLINSLLEEGEGIAIRIFITLNIDLDLLYDDVNDKVKHKEIDFGKNLNNSINMNEVVVGRDKEIKFIIETLLRKKKNNPILIGDAGVGKTAIVEELARLINKGLVPSKLKNSQIISLEMASVVAGTKYRGEFEEKLTKIIEDIKENKNIILFIDEVHTVVSAGGAEGAISAGDILKPYLARDNLKIIGATTTEEYDKYIANDKALARRFEKVLIKEPSKEETIYILSKIKKEYEKYHNVKIDNEIINKIVEYSSKYIINKKNPDKSIDLLDSVCTMVHVKTDNNKLLEKYNTKLLNIKKEKEKYVYNNNFKKAVELKSKETSYENKIKEINKQKEIKITEKDILEVLEYKSNVPVLLNKKKLINKIKTNLEEIKLDICIINQITDIFTSDYLNNNILSLYLKGPTKRGKTDTISAIINAFNNNINIIKLDGSSYSTDISVSKLLGTSAGYVGYNDSFIFSKLKHNPYALIVIENYHYLSPVIKNIFNQILEDNYITDNKGDIIDFKNCIIIATETIKESNKVGFINQNNLLNLNNNNKFKNIILFNSKNKVNI